MTDAALQDDLQYWETNLRGAPPLLELSTNRPRPPVQSHQGSTATLTIGNAATRRLKELCTGEGVTLYMALLAAFQVLLWRYSGAEDFVVGTPLAGRDAPEVVNLIGCFVNTCVVRTDLAGNPSFREVLRRVRVAALECYAHQRLPIDQLLTKLQCPRSPSYTPLFQVMFILQNFTREPIRLPGLVIEELEFDGRMAKFDLTLEIVEQGDFLYCQFEYRVELFEPSTIERMALHFQNLLESAIADPSTAIAELKMLAEPERDQILVDWNATAAHYQRDLTIARAFDAQAQRTPEAVALLDGPQRITYRELERRANQVARELVDRGLRPEMPIGVYLKRSTDAIIAILGVLKAGGLYATRDSAAQASAAANHRRLRLSHGVDEPRTPPRPAERCCARAAGSG